jgi:hypothetical protein
MARFLIEVPHEADTRECALAAKILISSGSHYLTHAEFGCMDGEHKAWIIVEADSKEEVRFVVPSIFRPRAKIIQLNKFSLDELDELLAHHQEQPSEATT